MDMLLQRQTAFRIGAGIAALLMGSFGIELLVLSATSLEPWYRWLPVAFVQLFFAWAFGAYAVGRRGPYNWRHTQKS